MKLYSDIVKFSQKLITISSQNGIDSESGVADLVFEKLSFIKALLSFVNKWILF